MLIYDMCKNKVEKHVLICTSDNDLKTMMKMDFVSSSIHSLDKTVVK